MSAPRRWLLVYLWTVLWAMLTSRGYALNRVFVSRLNIRKYTQRKRISKSIDETRIPRNNYGNNPSLQASSTGLTSDSGYSNEPDRPFTLPSGDQLTLHLNTD